MSSFLAMQAVLTLTNVQLAFSYVILFLILKLLHEEKGKVSAKELLILSGLIFIQWGLKFYAGFISVVIVGMFFC